jgi:DNA-directed RNA polymerase specialized sigma24 family protein
MDHAEEAPLCHVRRVDSIESWGFLAGHRERLVKLARSRGAGDNSEDIVQEALLRAASFQDLDADRAGGFLTVVVLRLVVDLHRRAARDRVACERCALWWYPDTEFEDEVCGRQEAVWAARLVAELLTGEMTEILWRRASGASWRELADETGESIRAIETRARRASLPIRRRVGSARQP